MKRVNLSIDEAVWAVEHGFRVGWSRENGFHLI